MSSWNGFDFFILIIFALNTVLGMSRGASKEIISMMCLCVALVCTIKFTVPLANFFNASPLMVDVVTSQFVQNFMASLGLKALTETVLREIFYSISLLLCFVGVFSVCEAGLTVAGANEAYSFPFAALSRKVGGGLGSVRGYIISIIFICILTLHIFKDSNDSIFANSFFIKLFHGSAIRLDSIISGQNPDRYKDIFEDKNLFNADAALEQLAAPGQNAPANPPPAQAPQPSSQNNQFVPYGGNSQSAPYGANPNPQNPPVNPAPPANQAAPSFYQAPTSDGQQGQ